MTYFILNEQFFFFFLVSNGYLGFITCSMMLSEKYSFCHCFLQQFPAMVSPPAAPAVVSPPTTPAIVSLAAAPAVVSPKDGVHFPNNSSIKFHFNVIIPLSIDGLYWFPQGFLYFFLWLR